MEEGKIGGEGEGWGVAFDVEGGFLLLYGMHGVGYLRPRNKSG